MKDGDLRAEQYRDASNLNARARLHARYSTNPYGWYRWVFDHLLSVTGNRILEVGCGAGALWARNAARVPPDWQVILTDYSTGMLKDARGMLRDARGMLKDARGMLGDSQGVLDGQGAPLVGAVVDAQALPFSDGQFDAAIANHMLYHVPVRDLALRELRRVLRPGGILFAATNGQKHMDELKKWLQPFGEEFFVASSRRYGGFDLETGAEQLAPHFSEVRVERYEDHLVIDEVQPLMDYVLSTADQGQIQEDRIEECERSFTEHLTREGVIRINKDTGLFIARRD